ncbi:hypothetical protein PoB_003862300 [Plakobranchus ocellatus]|uniref:Uncharacterized protein n=1 Tax=Plakobranchus ocellatus TaxID=259542 RepID=A0AAV4B047_9GAST|nr:hypothetical protein PoB_003862300 [Plakobranchus ocellatus]
MTILAEKETDISMSFADFTLTRGQNNTGRLCFHYAIRDRGSMQNEVRESLPSLIRQFAVEQFSQTKPIVKDNSEIPTVNTFSYLQSSVSGNAASAIREISLTAENDETAKSVLEKRFGRKQRIIFGDIQTLT